MKTMQDKGLLFIVPANKLVHHGEESANRWTEFGITPFAPACGSAPKEIFDEPAPLRLKLSA
jgi:hypothetical protein